MVRVLGGVTVVAVVMLMLGGVPVVPVVVRVLRVMPVFAVVMLVLVRVSVVAVMMLVVGRGLRASRCLRGGRSVGGRGLAGDDAGNRSGDEDRTKHTCAALRRGRTNGQERGLFCKRVALLVAQMETTPRGPPSVAFGTGTWSLGPRVGARTLAPKARA